MKNNVMLGKHFQLLALIVVLLAVLFAFDLGSDYAYKSVFTGAVAVSSNGGGSSASSVVISVSPSSPSAGQSVTFAATASGSVSKIRIYADENNDDYYEKQVECAGKACQLARSYSARQVVSYYAFAYDSSGASVANTLPVKEFTVAATATGGSGSAPPSAPSSTASSGLQQATVAYLDLGKSWNMLGINTTNRLMNSTCTLNPMTYVYFVEEGKYELFKFNSDFSISSTIYQSLSLATKYPKTVSSGHSAMWVYNQGSECSINATIKPAPEANSYKFSAGWNQINVYPAWAGRTPSSIDVLNRCGFKFGWSYDALNSWQYISGDTPIKDSLVGKGIWAMFDGSCAK